MMQSLRRMIGMRNKNKFIQSSVLSVLLFIAVAISVALTCFIFSSFGKREAPDQATAQQPEQQLFEVFRPTQYVVTKASGKQQLVTNTTDEKIKKIGNALTNSQITDPKTKQATLSEIKKVLSLKKSQIFRYPDVIPMSFFNTRYSQNVATNKNSNFDYFVLPLDHSNKGYFVNTKTNYITTVSIKKLDTNSVWQQVNKLPKNLTIDFKSYNGRVMLNYPKKLALPVYSYLVNHRDPKTYVSALLGTINQLTITEENNKTIYTNKINNQKIIYDPNWETVTFEENNPKNKLPKSYSDRLNTSISQINLVQSDLTGTRFYESQEDGKKITFRTYVEGFPVYFQSESGAIHMTMDKRGNLTSTYSLNEIGVPVPNRQAKVVLPSTAEVMKQLTEAGVKPTEYNFITPGYEWLINQDSQAAVNMQPTWMIETHTGWQSVSSFLKAR